MARARVAVALAVLAALCLAATAWLAVATYAGRDDVSAAAERLVVTDPASGATFAVPRAGWDVRPADSRISYGAASVLGPALYRPGYCREDPAGSFRAMAGFTDASLDVWIHGVGGEAAPATARRVRLADGTAAAVRRATLRLAADGCSSGRVQIVMAEAGGVRLVVLADTGEPGTLTSAETERIARSLELP